MHEVKVAVGDGFLESFAMIPKAKQKKVMEFVAKFRRNPKSGGINYKKINDARDPNFRSVRVDQDYRGIVLSVIVRPRPALTRGERQASIT